MKTVPKELAEVFDRRPIDAELKFAPLAKPLRFQGEIESAAVTASVPTTSRLIPLPRPGPRQNASHKPTRQNN